MASSINTFLKEGEILYKKIDMFLEEEKKEEPLKKRPSITKDLVDLGKGVFRVGGKVTSFFIDKLARRKGKIKRILRDAKKRKLPKSEILKLKQELRTISNKEIRLKSKEIKQKNRQDKENKQIARAEKREKRNENFSFPTYDEIIELGISNIGAKYGLWDNGLGYGLVGAPTLFTLKLFKDKFDNAEEEKIKNFHEVWEESLLNKKRLSYYLSQSKDIKSNNLAQSFIDSYNKESAKLKLALNTTQRKKDKNAFLDSLLVNLKELNLRCKDLDLPNY